MESSCCIGVVAIHVKNDERRGVDFVCLLTATFFIHAFAT